MPATTRRRPPALRRSNSSSSSSSSSRMESRRLVTASVFGNLEVGGVMRAILLGALVGGLVIFLFYPDITRLLQHWHGTGQNSAGSGTDGVGDGDSRTRFADSDSETQSSRIQPKNSGTTIKEPKDPSVDTDVQENSHPSCQCRCPHQGEPTKGQTSADNKRHLQKEEDLMEEEEEMEEEDPVEVILMEDEDPSQFIELDPEEDTVSTSSSPPSDDKSESVDSASEKAEPGSSNHRRTSSDSDREEPVSSKDKPLHHEGKAIRSKDSPPDNPTLASDEEPLVLTDGQPITFTPLSSGDEQVIRVGGRPKPNQENNKHSTEAKPNTKANNDLANQNSSTKPNNSKQSSTKTKKKEPPTRSPESGSKKNKASKKVGESQEKGVVPEEVKNFQPSFLRAVTAKKIFADGRRIPPVELLPQKESNSSVRVYLFNEFLSEAECDGLRRVHDKHVKDMAAKPLLCFDSLTTLRKHLRDVKRNVHVTPNDFVTGTKCVNASFSAQLDRWMRGNWSYSTAFYPGESRFSDVFAARVQQAMGLAPSNGGKFQITSYPTGKAYKAHTDCVLEGSDQRDRVATVLVYLDDVEEGGETKFPELGIWVKPRKGRALVWNNMSPGGLCEPHSLHVASRVNKGSKYILIRWYYYKSFYSLGKRPPEPPLPARVPGTPRVSCDDYDNGSCRWYDEWNNDHLVDYEYNKYTLI